MSAPRSPGARRPRGGSVGWGWVRSALFLVILLDQRGETDGKTINAYIQTSLRQFSDIYLGQVRVPRLPARVAGLLAPAWDRAVPIMRGSAGDSLSARPVSARPRTSVLVLSSV
jgi:hypothetical protein